VRVSRMGAAGAVGGGRAAVRWRLSLHNITKKCSLLTVAFSHVDGGPPLLRPALRDLLQPETEGAAYTSGR